MCLLIEYFTPKPMGSGVIELYLNTVVHVYMCILEYKRLTTCLLYYERRVKLKENQDD